MKYEINYYRRKEYPQGVLLTTQQATWVFLNRNEYKKFLTKNFENDNLLFKKLEDARILITDRNRKELINNYHNFNWHLFTGTSLHIIVPTTRCNQNCIYCYALKKPINAKNCDMTRETAKKVVDFIFQTPSQQISIEFIGGEPLLNFPIVRYITEYSKERNKKFGKEIDYSVVTNATTLNDEKVAYLVKNKFGICISLDGPKKLHDAYRKYWNGRGSYDDVVYWIERIRTKYNWKTNSIPVITKMTFEHWKELVNEYLKFDSKVLRLKYLTFIGLAQNIWKKVGYTPEEFLAFWKKALDYMIELNKNGKFIMDDNTYYFLTKIFLQKDWGMSELQIPCGAVLGQMVYNYNGDVFPCDESRTYEEFKLGNVKTNNYREITTSQKACSMINISSNRSLLCDSCPWYAFCGLCPLLTYAMQNSLVAKLPFDYVARIHKGMIEYLFDKILFDREESEILRKWAEMGKKV